MANTKLIAGVIVVIVVVAAAVAAWQLLPSEPTIKIGLVAPTKISVGPDMDRAARMAVKEINADGGIYVADLDAKLKIKLLLADTGDTTDTETSVTAVKRVIDQGADLLIGGFSSGATLNDQVYAIEQKVPFIITGASSHLVTRRGFLPTTNALYIDDAEGMSYMFHYCTTTLHYSRTVALFFAEAMKPLLDSTYDFPSSRNLRLAVLYRNDAYGQGVWDATNQTIVDENLPIDVVAKVAYDITATTFQGELAQIKAAKPDAVYVVDFTANTATIYRQGQNDVGLNSIYIAVEACEEPEFYTQLEEWGDEQLLESKFASYAGPPFYLPTMDTYVANYLDEYGVIPGMMGADTYDAFYLAKQAILDAGTLDKSAVRDAIENIDMEQMLIITDTGRIQFSTDPDSYHEFAPFTFVEQLFWDESAGETRPKVIWPATAPGVAQFKQTDFVLPENYEPGS